MKSKLILALDFPNQSDCLNFLNNIHPHGCALKIGSELFTSEGPKLIETLVKQGFEIFLDLKFHDIPNTVAKACHAAAKLGVSMINVHTSGGKKMMEAAKEALHSFKSPPLLIGVTVLTSVTESEYNELGYASDMKSQIGKMAQFAQISGLDGVVCSAHEIPDIKELCGSSFLTVTPGIRFATDSVHDQARVMTPEQAVQLGADYLVMGRPITEARHPNIVIERVLNILSSPNNHIKK